MKAIWQGTTLAASDDTVVVEGNHYFPAESLNRTFFRPSSTTSRCPWKGVAHYYDVAIGDQINRDAAWYYPETSQAAKSIEGRVAFWRGIQVVADDAEHID